MNLFQYGAADPCNKVDTTGGEWCWAWEDDCGVDWELVTQIGATAEFVFGCGTAALAPNPLSIAVCADGVDNFAASVTHQPTMKQTIVSGGLQLGGMSKERADNIGRTAAMVISGALSAQQAGKVVAKEMGNSFRRKAVTSWQSSAAAAPTTARVISRTPIVAKDALELDTNMLIAAAKADHPQHGLVMAFLESNKDAVKVIGAPALREAGAKTGNSLIKRTLKELGIRADISRPVESLTQLAERYIGAFSRSESKLRIADALNLASAQMAGRTLVTRDIQFYKRAADLGITDIQFVGSPENMKLAAGYVPPTSYLLTNRSIMAQTVFRINNPGDGGLGQGGGLLQEIPIHPAQHTAHPSKRAYWRLRCSSTHRIPEDESVNPYEGGMAIRAATRNEPNGTNYSPADFTREYSIMTIMIFLHPSVDIDPIPTGAGGIVRGATVTITGKAACVMETVDTNAGDTEEDSPSSITEVAVRLGSSGAFVKARATGPVGKVWTRWTTDPLTITGVVNDALQVTARVSAGPARVGDQPTVAHDTVTVTVDRTPPVLTLNTPDDMTQAVDNGKTTFQLAGAARDERSPVVAVEWVLGQGQQFTLATPKAAGDWSSWTADVEVSPAGTYSLFVRARDGEGNVTAPQQVTLHAIDPFQPRDPSDVFGQAFVPGRSAEVRWTADGRRSRCLADAGTPHHGLPPELHQFDQAEQPRSCYRAHTPGAGVCGGAARVSWRQQRPAGGGGEVSAAGIRGPVG